MQEIGLQVSVGASDNDVEVVSAPLSVVDGGRRAVGTSPEDTLA